MEQKSKYSVIGVMSGTSLDGLDLAFCNFNLVNREWQFEILAAETISYSNDWKRKLMEAPLLKEADLNQINQEYGKYIGNSVAQFMVSQGVAPEMICSHGHTILHKPENGITFQLGSGEVIAATAKMTVVSNFRALDVSLGGQGAPLVPVGDKLLFADFDYCLNMGGFGNISFEEHGERKSFDICPVNMALNEISSQMGLEYDNNGENASRGSVNYALLDQLNNLAYYNETYPKSLSREWYEENFRSLLEASDTRAEETLCTLCEHIAEKVAVVLERSSVGDKLLITGGGTHNNYLIDQIRSKLNLDIHIPSVKIIDYKEALIFGFLGILRVRNEINCLKSVTGAERDSSVGDIHDFSR